MTKNVNTPKHAARLVGWLIGWGLTELLAQKRLVGHSIRKPGAVLEKKYLGGLAPHHLGGNNS